MPTLTYIPLANITLGSTAASVTFGSIPSTFRDLVLVLSARNTIGNGYRVHTRINGDAGNNYSTQFMGGEATVAVSFPEANQSNAVIAWTDSTNSGLCVAQFFDYSANDKHKTILSRSGNSDQSRTYAHGSRWANTAPITSIQVLNIGTPLFTAGSTFALYGIAA
jgi:hypothetical protein